MELELNFCYTGHDNIKNIIWVKYMYYEISFKCNHDYVFGLNNRDEDICREISHYYAALRKFKFKYDRNKIYDENIFIPENIKMRMLSELKLLDKKINTILLCFKHINKQKMLIPKPIQRIILAHLHFSVQKY